MTVSIGLAFLAGLASFLSPCVLPLLPAFIGYFGGRTLADNVNPSNSRRLKTLAHGLIFVAGFSLVFIGLGSTFSFLGSVIYLSRDWLSKIGGIVVILFGLHIAGIIHISWFDHDLRPRHQIDQKRGFFSSFLMGVIFSAGWSPCIGPVLGAILTLAMNKQSVSEGTGLLVAYSAGMAVPFMLSVLVLDWISARMQSLARITVIVQKILGVFLALVGLMLLLGLFEQIARVGYNPKIGF